MLDLLFSMPPWVSFLSPSSGKFHFLSSTLVFVNTGCTCCFFLYFLAILSLPFLFPLILSFSNSSLYFFVFPFSFFTFYFHFSFFFSCIPPSSQFLSPFLSVFGKDPGYYHPSSHWSCQGHYDSHVTNLIPSSRYSKNNRSIWPCLLYCSQYK